MSNPTELPDLDLNELEAIALAATPGPWKGDRYDGTIKYDLLGKDDETVIHGDNGNSDHGPFGIENEEDANYLLAFHPETVLALIALARRAQPEGEAPQAVAYDQFVDLRKILKTPGYCDGTKYTERQAFNMAVAATLSPLCGAQPAAAVAPSLEDCPEDDQQWAKVDPAVAFHLIERHAEDWADAGRLMLQWHNAMSRAAQLDGGQEGSESNG